MNTEKNIIKYLKPAYYIDSDSKEVINYAQSIVKKNQSDIDTAIELYYAIRDGIEYNPYQFSLEPDSFKASLIQKKESNFCVPKAILLAAVARVMGIPSRLGFANVKNHLITKELYDIMQTNIFIYHGFTELYLDEKWVKATPAFNKSMCDKFGVKPLEFDGKTDSIFHEFDKSGNKHMEYLKYHGHYADLPYEQMLEEMKKQYPSFFSNDSKNIRDFNITNKY